LLESLKHAADEEVHSLVEQLDQLADTNKSPGDSTDRIRRTEP
jgi:hypothetical protein